MLLRPSLATTAPHPPQDRTPHPRGRLDSSCQCAHHALIADVGHKIPARSPQHEELPRVQNHDRRASCRRYRADRPRFLQRRRNGGRPQTEPGADRAHRRPTASPLVCPVNQVAPHLLGLAQHAPMLARFAPVSANVSRRQDPAGRRHRPQLRDAPGVAIWAPGRPCGAPSAPTSRSRCP